MSEALTRREEKVPVAWEGSEGVKLASLDEAYRFAKYVVASGLAPKGDTPETVIVKAQFGAELGLSFLQSLSSVNVINGRPNLSGQAALALIRASKVCKSLRVGNEGTGDDRCGFVEFVRADNMDADVVKFTMGDAKRAGLAGKGVWAAFADDMLIWRAVSRATKRYFSDVLHGFEVAEVHREYAPAPATARVALTAAAPSEPDPIFDALPVADADAEPPPGALSSD